MAGVLAQLVFAEELWALASWPSPLLLHDVDAGWLRSPLTLRRAASRALRAAISDTSLREPGPSRAPCRPCIDRIQFFDVGPFTRETVAVSIFTGPCFAFDVERLKTMAAGR